MELINNHPSSIECVFFSSKFKNKPKYFEFLNIIEGKLNYKIDDEFIRSISDKENSDVIITFKEYKQIFNNNKKLIIENETDVGSIGTIIRTSVAFDYKQILIVTRNDFDVFDSYLIRASMGAIFMCNVATIKDINEYTIKDIDLYIKKDKDLTLPFQIKVAQILYNESIK